MANYTEVMLCFVFGVEFSVVQTWWLAISAIVDPQAILVICLYDFNLPVSCVICILKVWSCITHLPTI